MIKELYSHSSQPYTILADVKHSSVFFYVYEGTGLDVSIEALFDGYIKWDGCSNWNFPNGNIHFIVALRMKH